MSDTASADAAASILGEIGVHVVSQGTTVRARCDAVPEVCVPGTATVRTSVLATWSDIVTGAAAGESSGRRIPLTLDLEVQLVAPVVAGTVVDAEASTTKAGRTVIVTECTFRDAADGRLLAVSVASFALSPDPTHVFPGGFPRIRPLDRRLPVPLAERADCRVVGRGIAEMPRRLDGLNASGAIQGGLVALVAEEAATSLVDGPSVLDSLVVRYLRPFTVGPARAVAEGDDAIAVVRLTDIGTGKLAALATTRRRPASA